jgi:hypothetical protein
MTGLVDDKALSTVTIVGEPKTVGAEIVRSYTGSVGRFRLSTPCPSTTTLAQP